MMKYFRKPDASIWGVVGLFKVSRPLARKIRDHTLEGSLDWVMGEEPDRAQEFDAEWQGFLMAHPIEFSMGVDAYKQELGRQIQTTEICLGTRAGYMPPKIPYTSAHRPFVESVFKRNRDLVRLRSKFDSALRAGDVESFVGPWRPEERVGLVLSRWRVPDPEYFSTQSLGVPVPVKEGGNGRLAKTKHESPRR